MMNLSPMYFFPTTNNSPPAAAECLIRFSDVCDFFFVAHPQSGRREGEEEKRIMYFYPKHETHDRQVEVTGFAEAVCNFTDNFVNPEAAVHREFPHRVVTTKNTEQVYLLVENSQFLIGVSLSRQVCVARHYPVFPLALKTVLLHAYKMFRLFFGDFTSLSNLDEKKFQERLEYFFSRYLPLLKLNRMPLIDMMEGTTFLPLAPNHYLTTVTLVDEVMEEFPQIEKTLVMYQDKLLYYNLSMKDLPVVCYYLVHNLFPMSMESDLELTRHSTNGRFLKGPSDLSNDAPLLGDDALPVVHLHSKMDDGHEEVIRKYQMMVYRSLSATFCMFVRGDVSRRFMRNVDGFLGSELSKLASSILESTDLQAAEMRLSGDFHYIYFNPSSLSLTSSFEDRNLKLIMPPMEVCRLTCESMKNFMSDKEEFGECCVKSEKEWWIVLKKVNNRLLCLLFPPLVNQQSLSDIQTKTQQVIKSHFDSIFFS